MSDPTFMPYEVEGIFLAEGKTLRIGVKSIGVLSNSWTVIDNFELWFSGNSSSTTDYKDVLIDCIDEAYKLTEEEILFADRETLHVAIEEAMKSLEATTSEELKSATATLVVAIEEAKYAITLLNEFLNGVYKKVKEYSSDEDQIVQIMIAADENVESILDNPTTNKATLEDLKQKLTSLLNFATTFVVAKAEMEIEGLYNMEALFEFEDAFNGILDLMADGDLNNVEGALLALDEALITLRNSALNPDSDYTVWINNPNFEDEMKEIGRAHV